jgi:hypothetical protein
MSPEGHVPVLKRLVAVAAIIAITASCATKIPPADTFDPAAWSRVEALKPGAHVDVRYVSTASGRPLRQQFEGTLLAATGDILEVDTKHGVQRLMPSRVLRVGVGERRNVVRPLGLTGAVVGAVLGGIFAEMHESSGENAAVTAGIGAALGALLGTSAGLHLGDRRPLIIYSRSGSR